MSLKLKLKIRIQITPSNNNEWYGPPEFSGGHYCPKPCTFRSIQTHTLRDFPSQVNGKQPPRYHQGAAQQ